MNCPDCGKSVEAHFVACPWCARKLSAQTDVSENPFDESPSDNPFDIPDDPEQQLRHRIREALADKLLSTEEKDTLFKTMGDLGVIRERAVVIFAEERARADTRSQQSAVQTHLSNTGDTQISDTVVKGDVNQSRDQHLHYHGEVYASRIQVTAEGEYCTRCGQILKDNYFQCPECHKLCCSKCRTDGEVWCRNCDEPRKIEREAKRQTELEVQLKAKRKAEIEAKRQEEREAKRKAELEAIHQKELEARRKADAETKRQETIETGRKAEVLAKTRAKRDWRAELEAKEARLAEKRERKRQAELEARRQNELKSKRQADAPATRQVEFKEGLTVGIDLGLLYSTLAYLHEDGTPVPVEDEQGKEGTPSVVLLAQPGRVIAGPNRMRAAMEDPKRILKCIKWHMGETEAEFAVSFDGHKLTPELIVSMILKKLKTQAEEVLGSKVANCVITVPNYFNNLRRKATKDAGEIAGLNVIDIIDEPTASVLSYAWTRKHLGNMELADDSPRHVLLYDLGGSFEVTVVRYTPTLFQILATDGDVFLGGMDFDNRILEYVADEFKKEHGEDPREMEAATQLLRYQCEIAKIELSDTNEVTIKSRYKGMTSVVKVTREKFEELTADLVQRTLDTTELVMKQAGLSSIDLEAVVLVGGSSLMPIIPEKLEQLLGRKPDISLSPYKAVSQGAALHASSLRQLERLSFTNVKTD